MHWWVLAALQLGAFTDYTLNRCSHRKDSGLGQVMYAAHTCETQYLFILEQAVGQLVQYVTWRVRVTQATCRCGAQVAQNTPRITCPCSGAAPLLLEQDRCGTYPAPAPVEQDRCDRLSDSCPLSHNAFSSTSVGGRVWISRFGKGKLNVKDNASRGQDFPSSEWLFWWMQVKHKKLYFLWKSQYFLLHIPLSVLRSSS